MLATAVVAMSMSSCSNDNEFANLGEGRVVISTDITADATPVSRASQTELRQELSESFILWISNTKGVVRQYKGLDNVPTELSLVAGTYVAEAWAGDSVAASWDKRWFRTAVPFEVKSGVSTPVNLNCKIANVVVSVEYSDDVNAVLKDYTLDVGHSLGRLTFDDEHINSKGYFMMSNKDKNLSWTLTGTKKSDGITVFTRTNKIANVKGGYEYKFKVSCKESGGGEPEDEIGGGFITIEVEEIALTNEESIVVSVGPTITSPTIADLSAPAYFTPGEIGTQTFNISACSYLTNLYVKIPQLTSVLGIDNFDALNISTQSLAAINAAGISFERIKDTQRRVDNVALTLSKQYTDTYFNGLDTYTVEITARDEEGFVKSATAQLCTNAMPIVLNTPTNVTMNSATLNGTITHPEDYATTPSVKFSYTANGVTNEVPATVNGDKFFDNIEGLSVLTTYSYTATITGNEGQGSFTTDAASFTTINGPQLPNSGFEDWQTSSAPYLIYAAGGEMFWDSGNHGSATMSKNVTVPDNEFFHSGSRSIKLQSQFVGLGIIGKFAAGNVFVGKYIGTEGTDGIIGFGRPFTARPKGLKGYVKYVPGTVEYTNTAVPDIVKGQPDKGIIYMALLDGTTDSEYPEFPVVVKTKTSQFFNKDGANVIAYGEIVWGETIQGANGGFTEFYIPFEYKSDKTPSFILLTASASKGGDYFSGGASTMWLDDLELVY